MAEIRTATTLHKKRDEIRRAIRDYECKLDRARADLAHIAAAIAIYGGDKGLRHNAGKFRYLSPISQDFDCPGPRKTAVLARKRVPNRKNSFSQMAPDISRFRPQFFFEGVQGYRRQAERA